MSSAPIGSGAGLKGVVNLAKGDVSEVENGDALKEALVEAVAETDEVFLSHDIVIVCDLKRYMVGSLSGTTIDYEDGLIGKGFTFKNPNAKHSCGCGASYSA